MRTAEVIVDVPAHQTNQTYDYLIREGQRVEVGMRVHVPFGNRNVEGFVLGIKEDAREEDFKFALKSVHAVLDEEPVLTAELIELAKYMCEQTASFMINALQTILPAALKVGRKHEVKIKTQEMVVQVFDGVVQSKAKKQFEAVEFLLGQRLPYSATELRKQFSAPIVQQLLHKGAIVTEEQEVLRSVYNSSVYEEFEVQPLTAAQQEAFDAISVGRENGQAVLLHGVTGSGKTEVYMQQIEAVAARGKQAIVLVPEIALTPQMVQRFVGRFGEAVAVLHSRLSNGERFDQWRLIERGEVKIVVGTRSAIFAPLTDIGLIVIDEEHDASYKQENMPAYDTREMALWRAQFHHCSVIFSSATPSLETYARAQVGRYLYVGIHERIAGLMMPEVKVIDMREELHAKNLSMFSRDLLAAIRDRLDKKEQVILLFNRRGYATFVKCRECGYVVECPNCDISLTYHKTSNKLHCHYCEHQEPLPQTCPNCTSPYIKLFGQGTQRLTEALQQEFPDARILRMDRDTTAHKGSHQEIFDTFSNQQADILVGTQMIAKGLDFPNVTLVGVLAADQTLNFPDFRASERAFQLLTQVSGRAGRKRVGEAIIQTYMPDHYAIQFAAKHDYQGFYQEEMKIRKQHYYPPYCHVSSLKATAASAKEAYNLLFAIYQEFKDDAAIQVYKPVPALIARVNNQYTYQCLLKYKDKKHTLARLYDLQQKYYKHNKVSLSISV